MAAAGAGAGATAAPESYADYFADVGNDPYHGIPTAVYDDESTTPNAAGVRIAPAAIIDTVGSDPNPDAYLGFAVEGLACTRSFVIYRLQKVPKTRAATRSPFEGDVIANFGDLTSLGPTYVRVKSDVAFRFVSVTTPTIANMAAMFVTAGADPTALLGPFATGDPGTEDVECRKLTHIPYKYVTMALAKCYTPREAWETLGAAIIANGDDVTCAPLLRALRIAATKRGGGNEQDLPLNVMPAPTIIRPDSILADIRMGYLQDDLPARFDPNVGQSQAKDAFAMALTSFERRTTNFVTTAQATRNKTKAPSDRFGPALNVIYKTQNVATEAQLPKLYFDMAKAPKGTTRLALEQAYEARAMEPGAATTMAPVATPNFDAAFMRGRVTGADRYDLTTGVSLFQCPIVVGQALTDMVTALAAVDLAASGMIGTTLADTLKIQKLGGFLFPRQASDGELMLRRFSVAEDTHKGTNHPLALAIRTILIPSYIMTMPEIIEKTTTDDFYTARVLMAVHLEWYEWHQATYHLPVPAIAGANAVIPPPDFSGLFRDIRTGRWEPQPLPARFHAPAPAPKRPTPTVVTNASSITGGGSILGGWPPAQPSQQVPPVVGGTVAGLSTDASTLGGTPSVIGGPRAPAGPKKKGWNKYPEPGPDPLLLVNGQDGKTIRVKAMIAAAGEMPPARHDGLETCWAFHSHGGCSAGCDRAHDHTLSDPRDYQGRVAYAQKCREGM